MQIKLKLILLSLLILLIGCDNSDPIQTTKYANYYNNLREICKSKSSQNCCLASVNAMKRTNAKIAPTEGCDIGYRRELLICIDSFVWCEVGERNF
jgi:hypothetical protein